MIDLEVLELNFKKGFNTLNDDYERILISSDFVRFKSLYDFVFQNKFKSNITLVKEYFENESNIFYNKKLNKIECKKLYSFVEIDNELMYKYGDEKNKIILEGLINVKNESAINFECFDRIVKPDDKVTSYLLSRKYSVFNCKGWQNFYINLYSISFPNYKIWKTKSKVQFLKKISDNYFGFQLDIEDYQKKVKLGDLTPPEASVILTNEPSGENFQVLSDFKFPLYMEWSSPQDFHSMNKLNRNQDFIKTDLYIIRKKQGENIMITGDNIYGDLLKKNAQIYFTYSEPFLNSYLNFILNTISKKI
jgi:hypothetical protein